MILRLGWCPDISVEMCGLGKSCNARKCGWVVRGLIIYRLLMRSDAGIGRIDIVKHSDLFKYA